MRRYKINKRRVVDNEYCFDPRWQNIPMGGQAGSYNYNYGKINYCDRCMQGTGSFPISFAPSGQWAYDPNNGINYCSCCDSLSEPTTASDGVYPSGLMRDKPAYKFVANQKKRVTYRNIKDINRNIYDL